MAATINPDKEGGIATAAEAIARGCALNGALRDQKDFEVEKLQGYVSYLIKGRFCGP